MSAKGLAKWMKVNDKNATDVASLCKCNPATVHKYLDGGNVLPIFEAAFERLANESPSTQKDPGPRPNDAA